MLYSLDDPAPQEGSRMVNARCWPGRSKRQCTVSLAPTWANAGDVDHDSAFYGLIGTLGHALFFSDVNEGYSLP